MYYFINYQRPSFPGTTLQSIVSTKEEQDAVISLLQVTFGDELKLIHVSGPMEGEPRKSPRLTYKEADRNTDFQLAYRGDFRRLY